MAVADKKRCKKSSKRYWRSWKNRQKTADDSHNHKDYGKRHKNYIKCYTHLYSEIILSTVDLFICKVVEYI